MSTEAEATAGHLFAYFTGEHEHGERVSFAVSRGSEPIAFEPVAGGRPLLESGIGEGGVRDPFLLRDTARGVFVLLGTDLRVWPTQDWDRAVRRGSRSILVWESTDLVTWSDPWLLEVAPPEAGNAWAPKAFWSTQDDAWLLVWASALYPDPDDPRVTEQHQRVLCATTRDFRTVSAARTHLDPVGGVIDLTFLVDSDVVHRFFKPAAPTGADAPRVDHVRAERGTSLHDPDFVLVDEAVGRDQLVHGEGPAVARSLTSPRRYLLIDEFGLRGYRMFACDDPADPSAGGWCPVPDAQLPAGARHGSILEVTAEEIDRLLGRSRPNQQAGVYVVAEDDTFDAQA